MKMVIRYDRIYRLLCSLKNDRRHQNIFDAKWAGSLVGAEGGL